MFKNFRLSVNFYLNISISIVFALAVIFLINEIKTQSRDQSLIEAETKAKIILDKNIAIHSYFSHYLKPNIFKLTDFIKDKDNFDPSWMSSTYAIRKIEKYFSSINKGNYYYKECAINARSPENEADDFEAEFIKELNKDRKLEYRSLIRKIKNDYYFQILRRGETMLKSCLRCHSTPDKAPIGLIDIYGSNRSFNRALNETISAVSIRIPLAEAYERGDIFRAHLSLVFVLVFLAMFTIQYFIYRFFIILPINKLTNKAANISKNEKLLGEKIKPAFSKEIGGLTDSFNTMSIKLKSYLDELESKVETRTKALSDSNIQLQKALKDVKSLKGIIPICSHCKEIRNDQGSWIQLERYIIEHSDAEFSHGVCEKCVKKHYSEYLDENDN